MITVADDFFEKGCGRCPLFYSPQCKALIWQKPLEKLRRLVLDCGLTEEAKWGHPVYTYQKSKIVMLGAFKDHSVLSFFNGALLQDATGILSKPGENSQAARVIRFTEVQEIEKIKAQLKAYIFEAIEAEKIGLKVVFKTTAEHDKPEELQRKMAENPDFKTAFEALTPGRQRGYLLHFSQPKQSKTRESRIEKCTAQILRGKGLND